MGKVKRFEDLVAWQKARELTRLVYSISGNSRFAQDWGLRDQIRRASVSVLSNVAEGFDRAGQAEFRQFLVIAKGSCAEVRAQAYVALDVGYVSKDQFEAIYTLAEETGRIINGLRASIARSNEMVAQHSR
jgi:four helix bundle protein